MTSMTSPRLAAIEAVKELRDMRDAYRAVEQLMTSDDACRALLTLINAQFEKHLAHAEAAVVAL